jgi:hypothetical protein
MKQQRADSVGLRLDVGSAQRPEVFAKFGLGGHVRAARFLPVNLSNPGPPGPQARPGARSNAVAGRMSEEAPEMT